MWTINFNRQKVNTNWTAITLLRYKKFFMMQIICDSALTIEYTMQTFFVPMHSYTSTLEGQL